MIQTKSNLKMVKYTVIVKTGDEISAGTDSKVSVTIFGKTKNTGEIVLDDKNSVEKKDLFERNATDEFNFEAEDVGKVTHIKIGQDGSKAASAWFLESVTIKTPNETETWEIKKWLESTQRSTELKSKTQEKEPSSSPEEKPKNNEKSKQKKIDETPNTSRKTDDSLNDDEFLSESLIDDQNDDLNQNTTEINEDNSFDDDDKLDQNESSTNFEQSEEIIEGYSFEAESKKEEISEENSQDEVKSVKSYKEDENYEEFKKTSDSRSTKKSTLPPVMTSKSNEFTHLELKRIKEGLQREVSTIQFQKRKDHTPFVFNDLNPYYDVHHVENLINSPQNFQPSGYYNRYTAMNIVEPWVAYRMERTLAPAVSRSLSHSVLPRSQLESEFSERPDKLEGSTLAPNFPKIIVKKPKDLTGPFYVDDVDAIRQELKKNFKSSTRFEEDRNRTINDYFRMRLYETADRNGMSNAYHAYLENTPGSKKALEELLNKNKKNGVEI